MPCVLKAQRVGLVLSGGGARGLAHIGVIKALEENHIPIDYITGTSAGAMVGSMYAQGYSPRQMDSIVNTDAFYNWATGSFDADYSYYFRKPEENPSWIALKFNPDSVFQTTLPEHIVNSVPVDFALMVNLAGAITKANYNFDSLFVPFRCVAADIRHKYPLVFSKGDLGRAVRASMAFPFYFSPVFMDSLILYDGGMYNNFPSDVMISDFDPDIIIGVNSSGMVTASDPNSIISQIRTMMTTPTNFSVICENGIFIEPNTDQFGLFDFSRPEEIIAEGYRTTLAQIEKIKMSIQRRSEEKELKEKRKLFLTGTPKIIVDKINVHGVNEKQAGYVRTVINPFNKPISIGMLKPGYFRLASDENVRSVFPMMTYNKETGYYDLDVTIKREKDLITEFGGNLSTRPISEAFAGAHYNLWGKNSIGLGMEFYFGKLYTSGQFTARLNHPARLPYYVESEVSLSQWDFYKSSNNLLSVTKPSYILQSEQNYALNFGLPARNKAKLVASASYFRLSDDYYQTLQFLPTDTADETIFKGFSGALIFERNTLNKKMYANSGTLLKFRARVVTGDEKNNPGSTSSDTTGTANNHQWYSFKMIYENFFSRIGRVRFGFYTEAVYSNESFFTNYTSSVLNAPAFEPLPETKTLFLPNFHSPMYAGGGLRVVTGVSSNLDFRLEGYAFQPYKELLPTTDMKTTFGKPFAKRYFIGSGGFVFHSPLGPVSVFVNYYDERKDPFTFLFHVGYIIFNHRALN